MFKKLKKKTKQSLPNLKQILGTKPKNIDEAQNVTKESMMKFEGIVDHPQVKRKRSNPSMANPKQKY